VIASARRRADAYVAAAHDSVLATLLNAGETPAPLPLLPPLPPVVDLEDIKPPAEPAPVVDEQQALGTDPRSPAFCGQQCDVAIKGYAVVTPGEEGQPAKIVMILDTREEAEEIARSLRDKGIKATVEPTQTP
jgi:hypothetical protein